MNERTHMQAPKATSAPALLPRKSVLQRAAVQAAPVNEAPASVHDALRSPGQPLDATTRAYMEPRFGRDFSGVRVHSDAKAAESARAVNALAYTIGRNVVFGAGQYAPETLAGRRLLAHELVHTIQQGAPILAPTADLAVSSPHDAAEVEAQSLVGRLNDYAPIGYGTAAAQSIRSYPAAIARNVRPDVIDEVSTPLKESLITGKNKTTNYQWTAKYSVYMYKNSIVIEVRIKLVGKVSEETKKRWLEGINSKWNNKYKFSNGKRKVDLSFWAVFTDIDPHVTVNVVERPKTTGDWNRSTWDAADSEGDTQSDAAAHEFGHMIGNKDEYNLPDGKGGKKSLDGVMSHASQAAQERHFKQFLDWLNTHRTAGEGEFKLEKVK